MSDHKLDLILAKLEEIQNKLDEHDKRFDQVDNRFEQVDSKLGQHESMLVQLIQIVGATNAKLDEFRQEVRQEFKRVRHDIEFTYQENANQNSQFKFELERLKYQATE